ncbi:hypothetical protein E2542_SST28925 [Spatholobus suberectus]|nr:hypothetical protein E2542_SST28925 [Spatholobus suberectus]
MSPPRTTCSNAFNHHRSIKLSEEPPCPRPASFGSPHITMRELPCSMVNNFEIDHRTSWNFWLGEVGQVNFIRFGFSFHPLIMEYVAATETPAHARKLESNYNYKFMFGTSCTNYHSYNKMVYHYPNFIHAGQIL